MLTWYTEKEEYGTFGGHAGETKTTKKLYLPSPECAQAVTAREQTHTPDKSLLASKNHMTYLR